MRTGSNGHPGSLFARDLVVQAIHRVVYLGDNLELMQAINSGTVPLIVTDPPFNTGVERMAEGGGFDDTWAGKFAEHGRWLGVIDSLRPDIAGYVRGVKEHHSEAMAAYLSFMAARLLEMARILTPNGSIFVHGDDNVTPYQKVLMDLIFGKSCFRNAIQWLRHRGRSDARGFARVHETILFYQRPGAVWNAEWLEHDPGYVEDSYCNDDGDGRGPWKSDSLMGQGRSVRGSSGKPWRGIDPGSSGKRGSHWALPAKGGMFQYIRERGLVPGYPDAYPTSQDKLDALDAAGLVHWPERGKVPRLKFYWDATRGRALADFISYIKAVGRSNESVGHVDQKPLDLYRLFIRVASNPGDLVLDPFGGCCTSLIAAQEEGRQWIVADDQEPTIRHAHSRLEKWFLARKGAKARASMQGEMELEPKPIVLRGKGELFDRTDGGRTASEEIELAFELAREQSMVLTKDQKAALKVRQYEAIEGKCPGAVYANGERVECRIGGAFRQIQEFEHDHIKPWTAGGRDTADNLQCICRPCNGYKGAHLEPPEKGRRR